jgi:DNA-directed RNA polymerase beta subunit
LLARRFEHDTLCESVFVAPLENKKRLAQVRTNKIWIPEVGDKFSSRHGQKGVVGAIYPVQDMPFGETTGIRPTLLMNSHAFPSRMTIGHIEEIFMGKCGALTSKFADGTPHHPVDERMLGDILESYGFARSGKERMISGVTGEVIEADIFVGVQSYQRLKQVVHDKEQARARGPRNLKTRQPVEGRSYEGGMRLGEMERDCIISHGAASTL